MREHLLVVLWFMVFVVIFVIGYLYGLNMKMARDYEARKPKKKKRTKGGY